MAGDLPAASVLTAAELGGAFGHERIVHAAVGGGTLCDRLRTDLARLAGFRAEAAIDWDMGDLGLAPAGPALQGGNSKAHD
jgi:hypothetical protein